MKKLLMIAMVMAVAFGAQATLLLKDSFSAAATNLNGQMPDVGTSAWSGSANNALVSGSLTAPAGFATSTGGKVRFGASPNSTNVFSTINSGTIYLSYLIQFNSNKVGALNILGLSINGAAEFAQLEYSNATGNVYYQMGLGGRSTNLGPLPTNQYALGSTHLIVLGYTFVAGAANDFMSLWIDPDSSSFGAGSAPTAWQSAIASTEAGSLNTIEIKNSSNVPGGTYLDELRIGTSWADVTPIPEPATVGMLGLGALVTMLIRRIRRG